MPTRGVERWEMDKPGCLIFLEPVVQVEKEDARGGGLMEIHESSVLRSSELPYLSWGLDRSKPTGS